ncbi:hypothetical protein QUB04_24555 [Microcoleus sp. D2_18a_B4]
MSDWRLLRCEWAIDPKRPINTSNALPLGFLGSGAVFGASAVAGRRLSVRGGYASGGAEAD